MFWLILIGMFLGCATTLFAIGLCMWFLKETDYDCMPHATGFGPLE